MTKTKGPEKLNARQARQLDFFIGVVGALSAQAIYDTFGKVFDFYVPTAPGWLGVGFGFGVSVVFVGTIFLVIYSRDNRAEEKGKVRWTYQGSVEPEGR